MKNEREQKSQYLHFYKYNARFELKTDTAGPNIWGLGKKDSFDILVIMQS